MHAMFSGSPCSTQMPQLRLGALSSLWPYTSETTEGCTKPAQYSLTHSLTLTSVYSLVRSRALRVSQSALIGFC